MANEERPFIRQGVRFDSIHVVSTLFAASIAAE